MKRYRLCILTALLVFFTNFNHLEAQVICDSVFMKEYTSTGQIDPLATKNLSNDEILVAGRATQTPAGIFNAMAVKLSASGSVIWSTTMGGNNDDRFTGVVVLNNGNYLFYGTTSSFGYPAGKVLLVCISSSGGIIWSRQLGTGTSAPDRIKGLLQFSDGDIIGTFNSNDSSAQSDPVVFKMDLNGTLKWARLFDNNSDESFTSIGFDASQVYVSGFYTELKKRGIVTVLNSQDGSLISAKKIYYNDSNYTQEVTNMEINSGQISYGLLIKRIFGTTYLNRMALIKADIQTGIKLWQILVDHDYDSSTLVYKRTNDESFLILRNNWVPEVLKLTRYLTLQWSSRQSNIDFNLRQNMKGLELTPSGGCITVGNMPNFLTPGVNKMVVVKSSAWGEQGGCNQFGFTFGTEALTLLEESFSWANTTLITPQINQTISLSSTNLLLNITPDCSDIVCTDLTPLPPACNKTSLIEYNSPGYTVFTDVANTVDGGKIVVGQMTATGYIAKFKNNGDIAWSKKVDQIGSSTSFKRVIKSGNYYLAFGNHGTVINNQSYSAINVVKLDENGTVLLSKELVRYASADVGDVFALPDGGFVIVINECWGCGYIYSDVIRLDSNINVVWKKEIKHSVMVPVYRSLYCTANAVYIGHDMYDVGYHGTKVGVQKLDLNTGNDVWSKLYNFGSGTLSFNKMIVSNDTLYAFAYKNDLPVTNSIAMLTITSSGNLLNATLLKGENLVNATVGDHIDFFRPTVALTHDNDFVMSNQVNTTNGKALNITRFAKDGVTKWSKNYRGLNNYFVYNIHNQSNGFIVTGAVNTVHTLFSWFLSGFIIKTDSSGQVRQNGTGSCETIATYCDPINLTVTQSNANIDSVIELSNFSVYNSTVSEYPVFIDANLFCNQTADCGSVNVTSIGSGCSLSDTLTYFLNNNNCGAVANWTFDTTRFNLISVSGDTLKLLPKQTGSSSIGVKIETPCAITTQNISVSILVSASSLNLGNDTLICPGTNITLRAGAGYKTYLWNNNSADSVLTINNAGLYYVTVTDNCGGLSTDSILITSVDNTLHITGPGTKCNQDTVILSATAGFTNYQWSPVIAAVFNGNSAAVYPSQTILYKIQAEKLPGCIAKDSFLVSVLHSPVINLGNDTIICNENSISLTAPSGFNSYQWSNGSTTASITVINPGVYFVAATFNNFCVSKDTILVRQFNFTKPFLGNDTSICAGGSYRINAGNYKQYLWSNGATGSSINPLLPGLYWVNVTDNNGCKGSDSIEIIKIYDSPVNFLNDRIAICWNENTILKSNRNFAKYLWSNGALTSSISVNTFGLYILNATDFNGCEGKDSISVIKRPDCRDTIYIPNAFTPNRDGKNDIFKPVIWGQMEKYTLMIYNRYGQVVFATASSDIGWDGTFKGNVQPGGVYIYICKYKLAAYNEELINGSVILIR